MNKRFTLVTIIDISETKRKRALERIFFHDVLNKTASLTGAFELLNDKSNDNTEEKNELIQLSDEIINDLNEEILLQKNLMDAESGDLETKISSFSTREIIEESVKQIMQYPETENKNVVIHGNVADEEIYSDPILLKRIIINMLKNAVEALGNKETVKIGCNSEQNKVKIWVYNPGFIPKDVQIQIFERTFSTKDRNRGLGTYSMKLLGEQYLGGKVDFVSTKEEGTTFFIRLPKG
jgi:K+-sensing histidine kinase KdpD